MRYEENERQKCVLYLSKYYLRLHSFCRGLLEAEQLTLASKEKDYGMHLLILLSNISNCMFKYCSQEIAVVA